MPDTIIELFGLSHAVSLAVFNVGNIRLAPPELEKRGVDLLFDLNDRLLGAQHTIFHSDEGHTPGQRGSTARANEEANARATQAPFGMYGKFDFRPALRRRVDEKIAIAARHDNRGLIAETWLLISANLPKWGAAGSTMIAPMALRADDLNALCHAQLDASEFECACLVLHLDRIVWGWDRPHGWRVLADPGARERHQHRHEMGRLIFDQIPARAALSSGGAGWVAVIDQGWALPPGNAWQGMRPMTGSRLLT